MPPSRSTSSAFARRQAAARSAGVSPKLPARLTTRMPWRSRRSRAIAMCSGVAQRQFRCASHMSIASNPAEATIARISSRRAPYVSSGSKAAFVAASNGPHSSAAP